MGWDPLGWFDLQDLTILFGLLFTAIACIIMGSGRADDAHLHHPGVDRGAGAGAAGRAATGHALLRLLLRRAGPT
jgi:hypothetical protein